MGAPKKEAIKFIKCHTQSKLKIILFLLLFIKQSIFSLDFDLMPTNIHFFGATTIKDKIIVYGSNGSYLLSTDYGRTWKQFLLHPYGNIFHMTNYHDTLWGVMDCGIIFHSTNEGNTWEKQQMEMENEEKLYFILPTQDCFFVRSNYGVYKLDKNLKVIKSLKNTLLNIKNDEIYDFNNNPIPTFKDDILYSHNEITLFKGNLLLLSMEYYRGLIVIDYDLNNLDTLPTKQHIYTLENLEMVNFLYPTDSLLIIGIGERTLFKTEDVYSKWDYFFPDTTFLNLNDPDRWKKWPWAEYQNEYFFWNNKLFMEINGSSDGKTIPSSLSYSDFALSPIKFYLKIFVKDEMEKFCDFLKYKNHFNDRSIAFVPSKHFPRENATKFIFTKRKVLLGDSIIIIPGLYKTIISSTDTCNTWNLTSCNAAFIPELILNDSTFVFFNRKPYYNTSSISFDGGVTFQPTELLLDTLYKRIVQVDSLGNIRKIEYENYDTVTYFAIFSQASAFYIDTSGRGFFIGTDKDLRGYAKMNFAYTTNYCKHFKFDSSLKITSYVYPLLPSKVEKFKDKYIFPLIDYEYPSK